MIKKYSEKIKIYSVKKSEIGVRYEMEKRKSFFVNFYNFLIKLGFDDADVKLSIFGQEWDSIKEIDCTNMVDSNFRFDQNPYSIDLIFGVNKVFVNIHTLADKQEEIVEAMEEYFSFE